MRSKLLFIMACVWLSTNLYAVKVTITGTTATITEATAGCLSSALTPEQQKAIVNLTISGTIDASDFKTMRDGMTSLRTIDLQNVSISEYNGPNGTSSVIHYDKDILPTFAFRKCSFLTAITIPNSIKSIESSAFEACTDLTNLKIPESVTSIGESAFENCPNLKTLSIGCRNPKNLGNYIFNRGTDVSQIELNVPSGTKNLYAENFKQMIEVDPWVDANLGNFPLFEERYFKNIIELPIIIDTPGTLGTLLAEQLSSLTNLRISGTIDARDFKTMRDAMPLLAELDLSAATIARYSGTDGTVDTATDYPANEIPQNSFNKTQSSNSKTSLTAIVMPSTLTSIGASAFQASSLTAVTIPGSVTSIGKAAFMGCINLKELQIPSMARSKVISIGVGAFQNCTSLTDVTIPESVTNIGASAFYGCQNLMNITIPKSVTSISDYTFKYCVKLKKISILGKVTSIGTGAFYDCTSLTTVDNLNFIRYIGSSAFYECQSLSKLTIPESITSISDYTFYRCINLIESPIPSKITSIGVNAFNTCIHLKKVTIPESVTSIGAGAFQASGLTAVTIPGSVTSIGEATFMGCASLTSATIPESVTSISDYIFKDCVKLNKSPIPSKATSKVTSIGLGAFQNCTSLTNVTIPSKVTSIGAGAFQTSGVTSIIIPDLVNTVNDLAFADCNKLEKVTIGKAVQSIGDGAFKATSLKSITIPSSVEIISDQAFADCNKLASVTLMNGIKSIGNKSFAGSNLAEITIPGSVKTIGTQAFADCKTLKTVTLKDGVQRIEDRALPPTYCITSYSKIPPKLSSPLESLYGDTITVYVPAGNMSAYKNAEYWNRDYVHIYEFITNPTILDSIPYLPDFTMPFINVGYLAPAYKDNSTTAGNSTLENDALSLSQNENSILAINGISKEGNGVLTVFKNENGGITINGINPAGGGTVTVRDMGGRVLQTSTITGTRTTLNRNFGAGIYLVTVNTQGNAITKKIVL